MKLLTTTLGVLLLLTSLSLPVQAAGGSSTVGNPTVDRRGTTIIITHHESGKTTSLVA